MTYKMHKSPESVRHPPDPFPYERVWSGYETSDLAPTGSYSVLIGASLTQCTYKGLSPVKFCMKMILFQLQIKPTE